MPSVKTTWLIKKSISEVDLSKSDVDFFICDVDKLEKSGIGFDKGVAAKSNEAPPA